MLDGSDPVAREATFPVMLRNLWYGFVPKINYDLTKPEKEMSLRP